MAFDDVFSTAFVKEKNGNSSFLVIHFCSRQKLKRNRYWNIFLSAQPAKNVIAVALYHGNNGFLRLFYICIEFTLPKIISKMKKC